MRVRSITSFYQADRNKLLADARAWRKFIVAARNVCERGKSKHSKQRNNRNMKQTIGILGTGRMAVRLARLFAECGHQVILGSRTPERASRIAKGLGIASIKSGSYEAAADAPVVLPSMFLRDGMFETLEPLRSKFEGKLWID